MSLVDVDSWITEYESCERLNNSIQTQLLQLERQKLQKLPEYDRLSARILVQLNQFDVELRQLSEKLYAQTKSITFGENERRRRQLETLQSQLQQRKLSFSKTSRSALLASSSGSYWQDSADNDNAPVIPTNDAETLNQRKNEMLEVQNQGLEALSKTISRQRALASQLGQEVEDQNDILDNLANTIERVDTRVHLETGNISQINRRDSTWGYWLVIIALFVAIVIVALL